MIQISKAIVAHPWFGHLITAVIVLAGAVIGLETSHELVAQHGHLLHLADTIILWIFVAEAALRITSEWPKPWRYFFDPWNLFDFTIIAVAFLPFHAEYVAILRLIRLLRVLRLVHVLPKLQIMVSALIKSIPSMGYVSVLLGMLFYVYAVGGIFLFGPNDPVHFGDLKTAVITLFRVVTADAWADLMYTQMLSCEGYGYDNYPGKCVAPSLHPISGPLYFISFIIIGAMIILNLFIGVIMNSMEEARAESEAFARQQSGKEEPTPAEEIEDLQEELEQLQERLSTLRIRLSKAPPTH